MHHPIRTARHAHKLLLLAGLLAAGAAQAQATFSGFLCCNMRTDGAWISDINYAENGKRVIAAGTPVVVTGYGRYRVNTTMDGQRQDLGNDYSRDLDLETYAKRDVVATDPRIALAKASPKVRQAVQSQRIVKGMTREQVESNRFWWRLVCRSASVSLHRLGNLPPVVCLSFCWRYMPYGF